MSDKKYGWNPKDYAENSSAQLAFAEILLQKLSLKGGESVLDIGCGDGKITAKIASMLPSGKVVGVDSSAEMINFATEKFPASGHKNLTFIVMDARELKFDDKFDLAISNAALHWVKDHRPVLRGVYDSLKPGGKAYLSMGGKGNFASVFQAAARVLSDPRWVGGFKDFQSPFGFHGPDEYKEWLVEARLKPIKVALTPRELVLPGRDGLLGWVRTTWLPFIERVPEEHREIFVSSIADTYLKDNPIGADGIARMPSVRLEVEAEKGQN